MENHDNRRRRDEQRVLFEANNVGMNAHKRVDLSAELTGVELSASVGRNMLEELAAISLEYITPQKTEQTVWSNCKKSGNLKIADMLGPCSLVSFDVAKGSYVGEVGKYAGSTYLFFGQGEVVQDHAPDWLDRMINKLENGDTWGGYTKKFVESHGLFSNAHAVCNVEINGLTPGVAFENKVGMFSGYITGKNARLN